MAAADEAAAAAVRRQAVHLLALVREVVRELLTPVQLDMNIQFNTLKKMTDDHAIEIEAFKDALKIFKDMMEASKASRFSRSGQIPWHGPSPPGEAGEASALV